MRLAPQDLVRLRRLHLAVQEARVRLAQAQVEWDKAVEEIEEAYGLVGTRAQVDIATGEITEHQEASKETP
ncbi:MAG: hypothetical protein NZ951_01365 [Dehalococcoidia bacterium]|nr:hypothetical protein [Dehalococcoidia bacterium]MDW8119481.1 hypothetical protein [Chloroflexota bacterium]